jgi:HPt (histidine-containing phosphotransfer) domain-containing protein
MKECCREYLSEQFGGDVEIMKEIYDEYVKSVMEKKAELAGAIDAADWRGADRMAHTLKGNALASGDAEMCDVALELRKTIALSDANASRALLSRVEELSKGL